jgi:Zn-dependent peptidase ImmA (M78 family)
MARALKAFTAALAMAGLAAVLAHDAMRFTLKADTVRTYMGIASAITGRPATAKLPVVRFMPGSFFSGADDGFTIVGLYTQRAPGVIYLNANAPRKLLPSILVHELTHYLQHPSWTETCQEAVAYELEAYRAQYLFEEAAGIDRPHVLPPMECK